MAATDPRPTTAVTDGNGQLIGQLVNDPAGGVSLENFAYTGDSHSKQSQLLVAANGVSLNGVLVDVTQPTDGQALTYDAATTRVKFKPAAAGLPADTIVPAATRIISNITTAGDTQPAWRLQGNGGMTWGPGGTTPTDTAVARYAAGWLSVADNMTFPTNIDHGVSFVNNTYSFGGIRRRAAVGYTEVLSQNHIVLAPAAGNKIYIADHSSGTLNTLDTTLYRGAADRLKTDDLFDATTLALATKVKAGTPADADWAAAPPDGTIVVDSTANKIWVRVGAVWKSVVVA